jgi:DNA-3-methyladenine glycosylase I
MTDLVVGPDGLARCPWGVSPPDYVAYHDDEWGRPLHGTEALYERLCLEAFQSGLSWITILRKRPAFRAAFAAGRRRHRPQPREDRRDHRERAGGPRPRR